MDPIKLRDCIYPKLNMLSEKYREKLGGKALRKLIYISYSLDPETARVVYELTDSVPKDDDVIADIHDAIVSCAKDNGFSVTSFYYFKA